MKLLCKRNVFPKRVALGRLFREALDVVLDRYGIIVILQRNNVGLFVHPCLPFFELLYAPLVVRNGFLRIDVLQILRILLGNEASQVERSCFTVKVCRRWF